MQPTELGPLYRGTLLNTRQKVNPLGGSRSPVHFPFFLPGFLMSPQPLKQKRTPAVHQWRND